MDNSSFNLDISVENVQECHPQRRNIYGSVVSAYFRSNIILAVGLSSIPSFLQIAESEPAPEANACEPIGEEPNRSFCDCKSACKTKQKNGVGRGCPCRTANLPCVQNRCKCGTGRKQCANQVKSFTACMHILSTGQTHFIVYFFRMFKLFPNDIYPPVPWKDKDATLKTQGRKSRRVIFSAR